MAYISFQPSDYFSTTIYTGTTAQQSVNTGIDMANNGSMVWVKDRNNANNHNLFDTYMGINYLIFPSATDAKYASTRLVSFDSTGYTAVGNEAGVNTNGAEHVAWNWLGGSGQSGSSNTDGDVTSTVSANTTSGFSMVQYVNPASGSPFTVGHGLGSAPKMIINKSLSDASNWTVWHTSLGFGQWLKLNDTAASAAANFVTATSNTTYSSYYDHYGAGQDLISYCFAEVKGFSKFGSYSGNGSSDGPFIFTGFRPSVIIRKRTDGINDWYINDYKRNGYNPQNNYLFPNSTQTESSLQRLDILSNGFKIRTTDTGDNANGGTYIYAAFAEQPLVTSNGLPSNAR
jgi:hypothetical protein